MPTILWEDADYFRFLASLLGIEPELIMAAYGGGPVGSKLTTVLYTPPHDADDDDPEVWAAQVWHEEGSEPRVERRSYTGRRFSSFTPALPPEAPE